MQLYLSVELVPYARLFRDVGLLAVIDPFHDIHRPGRPLLVDVVGRCHDRFVVEFLPVPVEVESRRRAVGAEVTPADENSLVGLDGHNAPAYLLLLGLPGDSRCYRHCEGV